MQALEHAATLDVVSIAGQEALPCTCSRGIKVLTSCPAPCSMRQALCFQHSHRGSWVLQAALDILRRDSEVLKCYNDRWDAIWYAELGSSAAILNAGYNIASLLHRCAGRLRSHGPVSDADLLLQAALRH